MRQNTLVAALLAGSAMAMPWGSGGRWGLGSSSDVEAMPSGDRPDWFTWGAPSATAHPARTSTCTEEEASAAATSGGPVIVGGNSSSIFGGAPTPVASNVFSDSSLAAAQPTTTQKAKNQAARPPRTTTITRTSTMPTKESPTAPGKESPTAPSKETPTAPGKESPTSKASPSSTQAPTGGSTDYQSQVIAHHNVHRANHSAPDVQWDAALAATAQKIAQSCHFAHDTSMDGGGYGQNIQAGTSADQVWKVVTDSFYNGEVNAFNGLYGTENPPGFENFGHFSQVVWKATTSVGCATMHCPNGVDSNKGMMDFTVCNYKPPGNFGGKWAANVGKSLGKPTVNTEAIPAGY